MKRVGTMEWIAVAALTLAGALLRFPDLAANPPGVWPDEAIVALQGEALRHGERLTGHPGQGWMTWPVWVAVEAVATSLGGMTIGVVRFPAALVGTLTIPAAWLAGRALFGMAGGLGAATFIAGSLWHLQPSRIGIACITVPLEGFLCAWLLLGPQLSPARAGWAGAVAGLATGGYGAGYALPVQALLALAWRRRELPRAGRGRALALFIGTLLFFVAAFTLLRTERTGHFSRVWGMAQPGIGTAWRIGASLFVPVAPDADATWQHYPAGAPRLEWWALPLLVSGFASFRASRAIAPLAGWVLIGLVPEALAGRVHILRGLGMLAPIALLVGAGTAAALRIPRGWMRVLLAAAGVIHLSLAGWTLHGRYGRDPVVAGWFQSWNLGTAAALHDLALADPRPLRVYPPVEYRLMPVTRFLLASDLAAGRILPAGGFPWPGGGPVPGWPLGGGRHPVTGRPVTVIHASARFSSDRTVMLETDPDAASAGVAGNPQSR